MFTNNYDFHTSGYNNIFNNIIFANVCLVVPEFLANSQACQDFYEGILTKGIYTSVIKYSDYLQKLTNDFYSSRRTIQDQYYYLNDANVKTAETMQSFYLNISLSTLVNGLSADIDSL